MIAPEPSFIDQGSERGRPDRDNASAGDPREPRVSGRRLWLTNRRPFLRPTATGDNCRRSGKRQEAQEQLAIAPTMYREMGMTYWLDQVEKEMRELT